LTLDAQELAHHYEQVSAAHQFKVGQLLIEELAVTPTVGLRDLDRRLLLRNALMLLLLPLIRYSHC